MVRDAPSESGKNAAGERCAFKRTDQGNDLFQGQVAVHPRGAEVRARARECCGKILFLGAGDPLPKKSHVSLLFQEGGVTSVTTTMWGAIELHEKGKGLERKLRKGMRVTPVDPAFTPAYLDSPIQECINEGNRSVKGLLTQDHPMPRLGDSIGQDIMFMAKLHPRRPLAALTKTEREALHRSIVKTVAKAMWLGGRNDEKDPRGNTGGHVRMMDSSAAGHRGPECGARIVEMAYPGGARSFCPKCQVQH